jgi:putative endonuclease
MFYMYMLQCSDGGFYVGHTDNLEYRIAQHDNGSFVTCYTFARRPVHLVYSQGFASREDALAMERRVKGWSRAKKSTLIKGDWAEISRLSRLKYDRARRNPAT